MGKFKNYAHEQAIMDLSNYIVWYCQKKGVTLEVLLEFEKKLKKEIERALTEAINTTQNQG